MEQQIESTVRKVIQNQQKELESETGGYSYEVTENDMKEYMSLVIEERRRSGISREGSGNIKQEEGQLD